MREALTFVLASFAVGTLTRLVVNDTILDRPREAVASRGEWLEKLVTCPWCVSFWMALAVNGVAAFEGRSLGVLGVLATWGAGKLAYWWTEALASAAVPD